MRVILRLNGTSQKEYAMMTDPVSLAIERVAAGEIVVVTDDDDREHEGDLIVAAEAMTAEKLAFFLAHTSGLVCVALTGDRADALDLPPMVKDNQESQRTAFTVTVDLAEGMTTGISAPERARTVAALAHPASTPQMFVRPGHVLPLRAAAGGVLQRRGHTEAAVDLARMAGVQPAGGLSEIVSADRMSMARGNELDSFVAQHRLTRTTVAEIAAHRLATERCVTAVSSARIPTAHGEFECHVWRSQFDGVDHVALVMGDVSSPEPVLVRVHSECLTGDVLGSRRCDCGSQLENGLRAIAREGRGVLVYLRGHEGRGIGLAHKLEAYNLQDDGLDTVDANLRLGLPVDARDYGVGAQILRELGVRRVRLMTNNPDKDRSLSVHGIEVVARVPAESRVTTENLDYLLTKRDRLGHHIAVPSGLPGVGHADGMTARRRAVR
jgi:3,4-dihydroxy 2-butanone 4-phosphate synthase / GTP cyclohydrolase II